MATSTTTWCSYWLSSSTGPSWRCGQTQTSIDIVLVWKYKLKDTQFILCIWNTCFYNLQLLSSEESCAGVLVCTVALYSWLDISWGNHFQSDWKYVLDICRQNNIPLHILWTDLCIWEGRYCISFWQHRLADLQHWVKSQYLSILGARAGLFLTVSLLFSPNETRAVCDRIPPPGL